MEWIFLFTSVAFLAGVPGHKYSSDFSWENVGFIIDNAGGTLYGIWESGEAYDRWFLNEDTSFVGILFDANEDFGIWQPLHCKKSSPIYLIGTISGPLTMTPKKYNINR